MIEIIKFRDAVNNRAVTGTSGYDANFIDNTNQAQIQLINILAPHWEKNQAIKDMLAPFIEETTAALAGGGLVQKPADYIHMCAILNASGNPAYPINNNEVAIIKSSAIRKPSTALGNIFYYQKKNNFYFLPETGLNITFTYIRKPEDAALTLTPAETDELDYLVPSDPVNLEWPEQAFNILMYLVLERLGPLLQDDLFLTAPGELLSIPVHACREKNNPHCQCRRVFVGISSGNPTTLARIGLCATTEVEIECDSSSTVVRGTEEELADQGILLHEPAGIAYAIRQFEVGTIVRVDRTEDSVLIEDTWQAAQRHQERARV